MSRRRVLAIGLDGLELTLAERLMATGEMPELAALRERSARFRLDHGPAQRTGLAWEHVASGLSPEAARRWAAVEFDPGTYAAWQEGARFVPWWEAMDRRVVLFDAPYVDLRRAPSTRGIVGWGAHDPGAAMASRPRGLLGEFSRRFGSYPTQWTYGTPWPSAERASEMAEALSDALDRRSRAAQWLATERLRDWDFFMVVAGEVHGTIEGLWHGIDPDHPLHGHPSAATAHRGLLAVHRALDRMIGQMVRAAGDATIVAFAMGGMGPNHSDTQSMVLLPELLYRHAFGRSLLSVPAGWRATPGQLPLLSAGETWEDASRGWVANSRANRLRSSLDSVRYSARRGLARLAMSQPSLAAALQTIRDVGRADRASPLRESVAWQPALQYSPHWPRMSAFALPSFYDGRIRLNVRGRERDGMVEPSSYDRACATLTELLRECRNPRTGAAAVADIERGGTDPLALGRSESDLLVIWRDVAAALEHPRLGLIGPVPLRRTGGHTGTHGVMYLAGPGVPAGDRGIRSSFDVAPTIVDLLGSPPIAGMTGLSVLHQTASVSALPIQSSDNREGRSFARTSVDRDIDS